MTSQTPTWDENPSTRDNLVMDDIHKGWSRDWIFWYSIMQPKCWVAVACRDIRHEAKHEKRIPSASVSSRKSKMRNRILYWRVHIRDWRDRKCPEGRKTRFFWVPIAFRDPSCSSAAWRTEKQSILCQRGEKKSLYTELGRQTLPHSGPWWGTERNSGGITLKRILPNVNWKCALLVLLPKAECLKCCS